MERKLYRKLQLFFVYGNYNNMCVHLIITICVFMHNIAFYSVLYKTTTSSITFIIPLNTIRQLIFDYFRKLIVTPFILMLLFQT